MTEREVISRLDTIRQRDGRTDGRTDTGRQVVSRLRIASRGKKNPANYCNLGCTAGRVTAERAVLYRSTTAADLRPVVVDRRLTAASVDAVSPRSDDSLAADLMEQRHLSLTVGHQPVVGGLLIAQLIRRRTYAYLEPNGRASLYRSGSGYVTTLDKLLTPTCLCHQAV